MPAAFCGVVGLKPTFGRVSLDGVHKIAWTMDHAGPFGRTNHDARTMFDAIVERRGPRPRPLAAPPTFAVLRRAVNEATPVVRAAIEAALDELEHAGARIIDSRDIHGIDQHLSAFMLTIIGEASLGFEELLRDSADGISPKIRANLQLGTELRAADYLRAQRYRTMLRESVNGALEGADAIVTPTMQREPWTWKELDELEELVIFGYTAPFSLTGNPALSIPVPSSGLPVGLQLVGGYDQDEHLFDLGEWVEDALTGVHGKDALFADG
jgi:aspartyl-tRNA(Asn)/glutamyl-tRNA(Gln) amidotransferase subunit A